MAARVAAAAVLLAAAASAAWTAEGGIAAPNVSYSELVFNATYVSQLEFDTRAMGLLYNATPAILDAVLPRQAYPEGIVSVSGGHVELAPAREHWRALLAHYAGPLAVLLALLLVAVALPVAWLFWICCCMCGSRRARRPFDRKYDACRKGFYAILLIQVITLFLMGVVGAFLCEQQTERGLAGAGRAARAAAWDAGQFLQQTRRHAHHLLVVNFQELRAAIDALIEDSGASLAAGLGGVSRADSLTALAGLLAQLGPARADLAAVRNLTAQLRLNADRLNIGLRKVKHSLLVTLNKCAQPGCRRLQEKYNIPQLDTEIHYNQLPDVSGLVAELDAAAAAGAGADVAAGAARLQQLQAAVRAGAAATAPDQRQALDDIGTRLEQVSERIGSLCARGAAAAAQHGAAAGEAADAARAAGGGARRAGALAAAALAAAVAAAAAAGVLCGVCARRPDVYARSDCCTKATGARSLHVMTFISLLLGGVLALTAAAYFTAGAALQRAVCDPLTHPDDSRLFADLEKLVELDAALFPAPPAPPAAPLTLAAVMRRCHENQTLYETLELERLLQLDDVRAAAAGGAARAAAALRVRAGGVFGPGAPALLPPAARDKLERLASTELADFNFDTIIDALDTNLTSLSLDALAQQLRRAAAELAPRPGYAEVAGDLSDARALLERYHNELVAELRNNTAALNATALRLRDSLRLGRPSLRAALTELLDHARSADLFLRDEGPLLLQNLTTSWSAAMRAAVDEYLALVEDGARVRVARCGPLGAAFNATRDQLCRATLLPVHGYWLCLSWCVVLLAPLLALAPRLARLYRQLEPYPGPLVEAEYLYDAYADRDNVPLANAYKAEKRSRREAGGGGGGGEASRGAGRDGGDAGRGEAGRGEAGRGEAGRARGEARPDRADAHARRYNDMAPKHWEDGPPRYLGPTEYERPPPYYYPASADSRP